MDSLLEQSVRLSPASRLSVWPRKIGDCVGTSSRCGEKVSVAGLQFGTALPGKDVCQGRLPVRRPVLSVAPAVRLLPCKQERYKTLVGRQGAACPHVPGALASCRHEIGQRSASYRPCAFCSFFLNSPGLLSVCADSFPGQKHPLSRGPVAYLMPAMSRRGVLCAAALMLTDDSESPAL